MLNVTAATGGFSSTLPLPDLVSRIKSGPCTRSIDTFFPARDLRFNCLEALIKQRRKTMLGTILIVVIVLLLLGALPTWPHSRQWGYVPSGGLGIILLIFLVLLLMGRI
jgi:hypothetical protein